MTNSAWCWGIAPKYFLLQSWLWENIFNSLTIYYVLEYLLHTIIGIKRTRSYLILFLFLLKNMYIWCWGKWKRSLICSWILTQSHWYWVYLINALFHLLTRNCIIFSSLLPEKNILLNWISDKSPSIKGLHKIIFELTPLERITYVLHKKKTVL